MVAGYQQAPGSALQSTHQQQLTPHSAAFSGNEQKPQGIVEVHYPQVHPPSPYDPHLWQRSAGSPPPQELEVTTSQYPRQELPANVD